MQADSFTNNKHKSDSNQVIDIILLKLSILLSHI